MGGRRFGRLVESLEEDVEGELARSAQPRELRSLGSTSTVPPTRPAQNAHSASYDAGETSRQTW